VKGNDGVEVSVGYSSRGGSFLSCSSFWYAIAYSERGADGIGQEELIYRCVYAKSIPLSDGGIGRMGSRG
jgi:hypothetical protein